MKLSMARVRIVGLKDELLPTIHALHRLGTVQIDKAAADPALGLPPLTLTPATIQAREELSHLVTRCESLLSAFDGHATKPAPPPLEEDCLDAARTHVDKIARRVQDLVRRREQLAAEQDALPRYETTLRKLMPIVPGAAHDPDQTSVVVLVNRAHLWVLNTLTRQVHELAGDDATLVEENVSSDMRAMLIVLPRDKAAELEELLGREDISRLRLPNEFAGQAPDEAVASISKRLATIPRELANVQSQLDDLAAEWAPRVRTWRDRLRDRQEEFSVYQQLAETEYTFVLTGWTPQRDLAALRAALVEAVADRATLVATAVTLEEAEQAPVALNNPAPVRPFQSLVGLLAWPRYAGIDPTLLMAIFMPMFIGMILGDIGYGTLLLMFCLLGLRRYRQPGTTRDIIKILVIGAVWSIFFGFLYGELFGTLGEELGMHPIWIGRSEPDQVLALLIFSVAVGAVHVTLGLVLGVWEAWHERNRSHLLERGGMLVGLIGLFMLVFVLVNWLPEGMMTPALALVVVGIAIIGTSLGWLGILLGPIEFIGLIGNILSYLRIAAVGLASVYVALVANRLAGALGSLIVGIIVAVLIHALNLVLGAFSPTIHSLRLHYVEFFRKFYEGGGRPFQPFHSKLSIDK